MDSIYLVGFEQICEPSEKPNVQNLFHLDLMVSWDRYLKRIEFEPTRFLTYPLTDGMFKITIVLAQTILEIYVNLNHPLE